jgi:methylglutamate dehydrogenase subunit D
MLSPLAGAAAPGRYGRLSAQAGEAPGVVICELRAGFATLVTRLGRAAALRGAAREAFAMPLPGPGRCAFAGDMTFVWCGPERWLALQRPAPPEGMEARLSLPLHGLATVVEQSHGALLLRAGGRRIRDALAKGVPIDLHERAFGAGHAAATAVAAIGLLMWQRDEAPTYELLVARSVAASFWRWLSVASAAYGLVLSTEAPGPPSL